MTSSQEFVPDSLETEPEIPAEARDQIAGLAIELALCAIGPPLPKFSPPKERQTQCIELASLGFANGEIARGLFISHQTVKSHLREAYENVGARNINNAIYRFFEEGVLQPRKGGYSSKAKDLSAGELLSLKQVARGLSNPEMAEERGIGVETIKSQMRAVLKKLDATKRAGAVRNAVERNVLPVDPEILRPRRKILKNATFLMTLCKAPSNENTRTKPERSRSQQDIDRAWAEHLLHADEIARGIEEARRETLNRARQEIKQQNGQVVGPKSKEQRAPVFEEVPALVRIKNDPGLSEEVKRTIKSDQKEADYKQALCVLVSQAIYYLQEKAGVEFPLDKSKPPTVRIKNPQALQKLHEAGLIGEDQFEEPDLDIATAVAAIILSTQKGAGYFTARTRQETMNSINQLVGRWKGNAKAKAKAD